jgi:thymidylate synthase (FAD)
MRVQLRWHAPVNPDPDTYIALAMRRTRDTDPFENIAQYFDSDGEYCATCKRKLEAGQHDLDTGDVGEHKVFPNKVFDLIKKAKESGHFSVFEHVIYSFNIENVSRVLTHQLVRHRLASYSQLSARHKASGSCVVPPLDYVDKGQENSEKRNALRKLIEETIMSQWDLYDKLVDNKVHAEDARYVVGDGQTTSIIVTMNARSLAHFLRLRLNESAQWEIRAMASKMMELVKPTAPILWEGLIDLPV